MWIYQKREIRIHTNESQRFNSKGVLETANRLAGAAYAV